MKNKWLHRLGSMKLGIVLLIIVALCVIVGTVVVQKPMAEPGQIEKLYSPTKAKIYDALGLFDLFHAWWFTALLAVLMVNISCASLVRLPVVWREVRRHREPEETLMRAMPNSVEAGGSLEDVTRALRSRYYRVTQKQLPDGRRGLTADKQRYARLAPYFVHLSLLAILLGGVLDSRFGYRAFLKLNTGEQTQTAQKLVGGDTVQLPFTIRCNDAGMEQYPDGSPKRYWSKLAVIDGGREVAAKEIEVNSPLVYNGIRFFQSNFGRSAELSRILLSIAPKTGDEKAAAPGSPHTMPMDPEAAGAQTGTVVNISLDSETEVPHYGMKIRLAGYYPDFFMDGNAPATRSDEPNNPALKLAVTKDGEISNVWVFANYPQFNNSQKLPFRFALRDMQTGTFTGLQVASQPFQWLIWTGSTVLAFGLFWAFFFKHRQYWAIEREGGVLVAGMTSKHHEDFREEFGEVIESLPQRITAATAT